MSKIESYRAILRDLESWDHYLLQESRLPGPRANLELAFSVAVEGEADRFLRYAELDEGIAPANSKEEFLAFCGVLGLGYLVAQGERSHLAKLRACASDPRWRIREAVALGLQRYGEVDFDGLFEVMETWSTGNLLERRAAVATLCEPRLLRAPEAAERVLDLLDRVTASIRAVEARRSKAFRALRKGLGYGWSVAVAALPEAGKPRMERWVGVEDADIRWIVKQNLSKKRLIRLDQEWVEAQRRRIDA